MTKEMHRDREILQELGEWKLRDVSLPRSVELYQQLLCLQVEIEAGLAIRECRLTEKEIVERVRQGLPLLRFDELSLDWPSVQEQFWAVTDILAHHVAPELGYIQGLKNIVSNEALLREAIGDWYQGRPLSAIATEQCVAEELLSAAIQATLRPFLVSHAGVLLPLVKQELWRRRYCPVCGGRPDLAFLDTERGARWLLCSRCDSEWLFQRLECPYCGTVDQNALAFLTDDKGLYRLYTCDECHSYIKAVDLRQAETRILLPLERIISLDLDRQADEAGYGPG